MAPEAVLNGLRPIGMACEGDMFRATAGVNTHKGSIFFFRATVCGNWPFASAQPAGNANNRLFYGGKFLPWLTDRELRTNNSQLTAGQRLYQQLGLTGRTR